MPECNISHEISTLLINPGEKTITISYVKNFNISTGEKFSAVEPHIVLNANNYNRVANTEVTYKGYKVTLEDLITQLTLAEVKKNNPDVNMSIKSNLPPELIQQLLQKGEINELKP